jgi:hypothetical protein
VSPGGFSTDFTFSWNGEAIAAALEAAIEQAAERVGDEWQAGAEDLCPVRTGKLKAGIHHEVTKSGSTISVVLSDDVEYASFVILGTSKSGAQDFIRPPADRVFPHFPGYVRDNVASIR